MSWMLTAIKQIFTAIFSVRPRTIEISNKLFDEVTPTRKRRGARRKLLNRIRLGR